jgi:hypothetical protein
VQTFLLPIWSFTWKFTCRSLHHLQWRYWGCMVCGFWIVSPTVEGAVFFASSGYYFMRGVDFLGMLFVQVKRKGG